MKSVSGGGDGADPRIALIGTNDGGWGHGEELGNGRIHEGPKGTKPNNRLREGGVLKIGEEIRNIILGGLTENGR